MANCDECINPEDEMPDSEPWDCDCYSHNPHGSEGHEKNPKYKGLSHEQVVELWHSGEQGDEIYATLMAVEIAMLQRELEQG